MMLHYFRSLFISTWQQTEQNSIGEYSQRQSAKTIDWHVIIVFVYIAVGLTLVKYFGHVASFVDLLYSQKPSWFSTIFLNPQNGLLLQRLWWIASIVIIYLVIPAFIVKFLFKHKLGEYGVSFKNIHKDYPLYILMLLIMLPLVYYASGRASFQSRYPIFQPLKGQLFPQFIYWQLAYFLQFVAVEFFFRGFILHGLKYRFGMYSIFISMVPYCMIHFGKPFGETMAAILAGIALGTLSLKSRSIVLGILIHYSVAISMDMIALYREGYF